jgi:uncharacterized protein (TIGR00369 family)
MGDVAARWLAEQAEVEKHLAEPGVSTPEQIKGMSGMDFFNAIFEGRLPSVPIGRLMGFVPIEVEPGRMVFQGIPGPQHYNPIGSVHGGWIATLLDSALGCAVHSMLPAGKGYTTVELKINILRPVRTETGPVRVEGKIIHIGRQTGVSEARLTDSSGKLLAWASTTCLIFDMPA